MKSSEKQAELKQAELNKFNKSLDAYKRVTTVSYALGSDEPMATQRHLIAKLVREIRSISPDLATETRKSMETGIYIPNDVINEISSTSSNVLENKPVVHVQAYKTREDSNKKDAVSIWNLIKELSNGNNNDYKDYFEEVQQESKTIKRADLFVNYAGKSFSLTIDIDADKFQSDNKEMRVTLGDARWNDTNKEIEVVNQNQFVVQQNKDNLSIDITRGLKDNDIEVIFGDPNYRMQLTSNIYMPKDHQMDAVLALGDGFSADKNAQLIIAGTGTGKTGIGAVYAHAMGKAIIVVPEGLEKQAADDINDFIGRGYDSNDYKVKILTNSGISDEKHASYSTEQELKDTLEKNKFLVVNHTQLKSIVNQVRGKNLFIDEAHEITGTSEDIAIINQLKENNKIVGVTATPSSMTYEALGQPATVISLPFAQQKLNAVREVVTTDEIVGEKANTNNADAVATKAVELSVKNDWKVKEEKSAHGADVQGMIFTDNPEVTSLISHKLERELSEGTEIGIKMQQAQKQHIADSMNADLINLLNFKRQEGNLVTVDKKVSEKGLQKLARDGALAEHLNTNQIFKRSLDELPRGDDQELQKEIQERMRRAFGGDLDSEALKPYFSELQSAVIVMAKSNALRAIEKQDVDPAKFGAKYSVSLNEAGSQEGASYVSKDDAQILVKKGLTERVVSEGALGTGYSNPNILSTILTQTAELKSGDTAKQNQQAGRPIRDKDGKAFVGTVTAANVEHQRQTASSIYSLSDCITGYDRGLQVERELSEVKLKQRELPAVTPKPRNLSQAIIKGAYTQSLIGDASVIGPAPSHGNISKKQGITPIRH